MNYHHIISGQIFPLMPEIVKWYFYILLKLLFIITDSYI
jgi:hypothetical protein